MNYSYISKVKEMYEKMYVNTKMIGAKEEIIFWESKEPFNFIM